MAEQSIGADSAHRARADRPTPATPLAKPPSRSIRATHHAHAIRRKKALVGIYHTTPNILAASHFSCTKVPSVRPQQTKCHHNTTNLHSITAHRTIVPYITCTLRQQHPTDLPLITTPRPSPRNHPRAAAQQARHHPSTPPQALITTTSEVMELSRPRATIPATRSANAVPSQPRNGHCGQWSMNNESRSSTQSAR